MRTASEITAHFTMGIDGILADMFARGHRESGDPETDRTHGLEIDDFGIVDAWVIVGGLRLKVAFDVETRIKLEKQLLRLCSADAKLNLLSVETGIPAIRLPHTEALLAKSN